MCFFPYFLGLPKAPLLRLFYYKTPRCPKGFFLVLAILNRLHPLLQGPKWPAMCPLNRCSFLRYFLFFSQRQRTSWHWMFSRDEVVLAQRFLALGLAISMPYRSPRPRTQFPPSRPCWTSTTPNWSEATLTSTTQQPTPPGSSPPSRRTSAPTTWIEYRI